MTDTEKVQSFGEMVESTRKLTKPWIIALIVTNALWAAVTFSLIWFAYMTPIDVDQAQDFDGHTQNQGYSQGVTQGS